MVNLAKKKGKPIVRFTQKVTRERVTTNKA
jgi:hypothetical protein